MCHKSIASAGQSSTSAGRPKSLRSLALPDCTSVRTMPVAGSEPGMAVIRQRSLLHKPATAVHRFSSILCYCFVLLLNFSAMVPSVQLGVVTLSHASPGFPAPVHVSDFGAPLTLSLITLGVLMPKSSE